MKLRRIGFGILLLPFVLIALMILYEVFGMTVNHTASARQTQNATNILKMKLSSVEILDRYTETGNTSGTGNHVDMLTTVIFRTEAELEEIQQALQDYDGLDEWSFRIESLEKAQAAREQYPGVNAFLEKMDIPENLNHCWLLYLNTSAPFPDNIEGH